MFIHKKQFYTLFTKNGTRVTYPEVPALLFIPTPGKQFGEGITVIPPAAQRKN
jgi:hypothetical protein